MPVETAKYISDLVPTNPLISDNIADGPSHFWLIKEAIQNTFPNIKGAITASQDQLNTLMGLVGSSTSDGLDIKGNLTVEGKALVPSVTDWTQKQAVPASDADGRYLQLSTANTQTVSGPVTFAEKLLTPNVDDFTSQEAIPAAQADERYIQKGKSVYDYTPIAAGIQRSTGEIWLTYKDDDGTDKWAFAQPAGDYATNPALNTEITNRTNADTNLQNQINNRVQKTGDTMSGHLWNTDWISAGANGGWNGARTNTGDYGWTNGIEVGNPTNNGAYRASMQVTDVLNDGGANTAGINFTGYDAGNNVHQYYLAWNGNIQTPKGLVAFQSDLPFVDKNLRVQVWVVDSCSDGDTVTIPSAFSSTLGVIAQDMTPYSRYSSINPVKINTDLMSGNQFRVQIWSSGKYRRVLFVAYGYF